MKTKIEISGYEIEIEEIEGRITVKAEKDGETVEEFTLEPEEGGEEGEEGGEDVKSFDDFGGEEEEDFEGEEGEEGEEELGAPEMEGEEEEEESNESLKLESFQTFLNKNKKK